MTHYMVQESYTSDALALAAISPGHAKAYRTTPLFTNQEMMRSMQKAGAGAYQAPS